MKLKPSKRRPERASEAEGPVPGYMKWVLSQVATTGWAVPGVPGDATGSPWGYSIGLWANYGSVPYWHQEGGDAVPTSKVVQAQLRPDPLAH